MFPAGSMARTWKLWVPTANPLNVAGLEQLVNPALSTLHSKVLSAWFAVNVNVAVALVVIVPGFPVMLVLGGVVSTVHV